MKFRRAHSLRSGSPSAILRLEALEDRCCPAVIKISGSLLQVLGDGAADTIVIRDNGAGGIAVKVSSPKGNIAASATGIRKIDVAGGGGNDTITYTLTNALTSARSLHLAGGSGNDVIQLDGSAGVTCANLDVDIDAGDGNNQLGVQFGPITDDAKVNLTECLGKSATNNTLDFSAGIVDSLVHTTVKAGSGSNIINAKFGDIKYSDFLFMACLGKNAQTLNVALDGTIRGHNPVQFAVDSDSGNDNVSFLGTGQIDAGATLQVDVDACMGTKTETVKYDGVIKGTLNASAVAGKNAGTIVERLIAEPGSTGNIRARVKGSPGNDRLTLTVDDDSGGSSGKSLLASLDALLNGNGGTDVLVYTHNVRVIR